MRKNPKVLRIPFYWLRYSTTLTSVIADAWSLRGSRVYHLLERFAFCNDEKFFTKTILRKKKNLWVFRCNQRQFCGDFIIVDMSSPKPEERSVFVIDLKQSARLKIGGGGAGIQFKNATGAIEEIAIQKKIIPINASHTLLSGDKIKIMEHLGIFSIF